MQTLREIPEISTFILEAVANGIVLTDKDGNILWVNTAFTDLTGYELDEVRGKNPRILQSGYHDKEFYAKIWEKLIQNVSWRGEILNKKKDGSLYFEEMTITPIIINDKTFYIAIKQNITSRKDTEKRIKNNEEKFKRLFYSNPLPCAIYTLQYNLVESNKMWEEFTGYNAVKKVGAHIIKDLNLIQRFDPEKILNALDKEEVLKVPVKITDSEGNIKDCIETIQLIDLEDMKGILHVSFDITRIKQIEKKLQETTSKLLSTNNNLKDFAYMASHDLKEPLRTINSLLPIIIEKIEKNNKEEAIENLSLLTGSISNSLRLIDDLLDWCRIDGKEMEYKKTNIKVAIDKAIYNLQERINNMALSKKVNFIFQKEYPDMMCDKDLIANVYQNLISNALKFNASAEINIEFTYNLNEKKQYIFGVKDNGIGIEEKFLKYIFYPLKRLHRQDEIAGTGIGLSICKKILDRHSGKIWACSKIDKGSHFKFIIGTKI
jgi:PAS domain S-box-containing protein